MKRIYSTRGNLLKRLQPFKQHDYFLYPIAFLSQNRRHFFTLFSLVDAVSNLVRGAAISFRNFEYSSVTLQ